MSLYEELSKYSESDPIRFHMPGHKGKMPGFNPFKLDITEIPGFDDLHNPNGLIYDINRRLSGFFGAGEARLLVNGSTVGILSAVFAMVDEGDSVLISRSSHKSIYNALMLRHATPVFFPLTFDENGIPLPVTAKDIARVIEKKNDIKLAIITSPTYEGVVSDLKDISRMLSQKGIPLLTDAAHGAHLSPHAIAKGADIAVTSLHKTLPFLTQTSCLLFSQSGLKYKDRVDFYLHCFESSSPSYVLMAAADMGLSLIEKDADKLSGKLTKNLDSFYEKAAGLKEITIDRPANRDSSKIVITARKSGAIKIIGEHLSKANIIPEMMTPSYILCMASIMNEKACFDGLFRALESAESDLKSKNLPNKIANGGNIYTNFTPKRAISLFEAANKKSRYIPIEESLGQVAAGFVDVFPPGVPILTPGEIIEKAHIDLVKNAKEHDNTIRGLDKDRIPVV